jgi:hypothetical protein
MSIGRETDLFCLGKPFGIYQPYCTERVTFSSGTSSEKMSNNTIPSIMNLPVELIYRILDRLDPLDILTSVGTGNVCTRLDQIIETSHPYQVKFTTRHGEEIRREPFGISAEQTSDAEKYFSL